VTACRLARGRSLWAGWPRAEGLQGLPVRGNVVDLAVAVVIGAAFTAVVNAFTDSFLTPLIGLVGGGGELGGTVRINGQEFTYGAFISQVITFVLTAAVVYFVVVLPMKELMERRMRGEEPGPVQPTQVELLIEIRDLLRAQQGLGPGADRSGTGMTSLPGQL
jgi:large conductance mechanosensitive channel